MIQLSEVLGKPSGYLRPRILDCIVQNYQNINPHLPFWKTYPFGQASIFSKHFHARVTHDTAVNCPSGGPHYVCS